MICFFIITVILIALAVRIVSCIRKSRQPGSEWNLTDKYAANDFGE